MNLSLVLIRSKKGFRFTFTKKRNLVIGIHESSDLVVNDPDFLEREFVLGPDSTDNICLQGKSFKLPFLLPIYPLRTDGLHIYLVKLKIVLFAILLGIGVLYLVNSPIPAADTLAASQDWTPILLPSQSTYGFCRQDKEHPKGVRFLFKGQREYPYHLQFLVGSRGDGTSVTLTLNGAHINDPLVLPKGWSHQISIPLPSEHLINGENLIEVLPANSMRDQPHWGIGEVKVTKVDQPHILSQNTNIFGSEHILNALEQTDISGEELSRYYRIANLWHDSRTLPNAPFNKRAVLEQIERRMESVLYQVVFDVRAKEILDDHTSAQKLLDDTGKWIPESWTKGWKIYDELCR